MALRPTPRVPDPRPLAPAPQQHRPVSDQVPAADLRPGPGSPPASLNTTGVLRDARLPGRGNSPPRQLALQRLQQTQGNRAARRFVRQVPCHPAAAPQATHPPAPAPDIVLQRRPWEKDTSLGLLSYSDLEQSRRYIPESKTIYDLYDEEEVIEYVSPQRISELDAELQYDLQLWEEVKKLEGSKSEFRVLSQRLRTDLAFAAKYKEAKDQKNLVRMGALLGVANGLPDIPENYERGEEFARGGTSELYKMKNDPNFLIKRGGGRLSAEALGLLEIEIAGIPSVYAGQRQNEIIVIKIDGVGSKDIIGRQKQPMINPDKAIYVSDKTIDDLKWIYGRMQEVGMNIGDFQFIIRKSDGAVFLNDPVSVSLGGGPSGKIKAMIEKFEGINNRRKKGEYNKTL